MIHSAQSVRSSSPASFREISSHSSCWFLKANTCPRSVTQPQLVTRCSPSIRQQEKCLIGNTSQHNPGNLLKVMESRTIIRIKLVQFCSRPNLHQTMKRPEIQLRQRFRTQLFEHRIQLRKTNLVIIVSMTPAGYCQPSQIRVATSSPYRNFSL